MDRKGCLVTVTLDLPPDIERAYAAEAQAKGMTLDGLLTEVLLARRPVESQTSKSNTGALLVKVMQESPHRKVILEPARLRLPVRDVTF